MVNNLKVENFIATSYKLVTWLRIISDYEDSAKALAPMLTVTLNHLLTYTKTRLWRERF